MTLPTSKTEGYTSSYVIVVKHIILFLVAVLSAVSASAYNQAALDSLRGELAQARTTADSLRLSFDVFDASPRAEQEARAFDVLAVAQRARNVDAQLTILRNLAALNTSKDSLYNVYVQCAEQLPRTSEQQQTILYIKVNQYIDEARAMTPDQNHRRVRELMDRLDMSEGRSIYIKLEALFALCIYIEQISIGDILTDRIVELGDLLREIPDELEDLQSIYLTQASFTYSAVNNTEKAVESDKLLLAQIDSLEMQSVAMGRPYRDYSMPRYIVYRRLLSNARSLTPEEIERYYMEAAETARLDPMAMYDFEVVRCTDIYYYMARKDYEKALPLLKHETTQTDHELFPYERRKLLAYMVEAAKAVGDKDALLHALLAQSDLDDSEQMRQSAEQFKELRIIYERNNEKLIDAQHELDRSNARVAAHRNTIIITSTFIAVLLVLVFLFDRMWRKTKMLNRTLSKTNAKLTEERDTLRRTQADLIRIGERARASERQREEFINNMSHEVSTPLNAIVEYSQLIVDCIDEDKKPYLIKFARVVKLNTDLVLTLVSDVLDLASIDKKTLKIDKRPVILSSFAEIAGETFRYRLQPGVKFVNKISPDDTRIVITDGKRVTQVLLNLLINAAKFTQSGTITLEGGLVRAGACYQFAVTDTGIGIPAGKEEVIFNRFEKLNRYSQGIGIGLSVSRLVASLLGGEVKVDTSHKGPGARFIFTIPVK